MQKYSVEELAKILDGEFYGDGALLIKGVSSIERAGEGDLCYFDNPSQVNLLGRTKSVVLLTEGMRKFCKSSIIVVSNPFLSMSKAIQFILPKPKNKESTHPKASIEFGVETDESLSVGASTYIARGAKIGKNVTIGAHCVIEAGVEIADDSCLQHSVVIHKNTKIGKGVIVDSGSVVGARPFNAMKEKGKWFAGPDVGGVVIGDYSEIGANTTIDRGSINNTIIGQGVFIDNLVQVGHDATIGDNTVVVSGAAIGAHTFLGKVCSVGGASTIAAMLKIADGVSITGCSTVT